MKTLRHLILRASVFGLLFGCSEVAFRQLPSQTCASFNNNSGQTCQYGADKNTYTVTFRTGAVDILIVNDNSSSMSREQKRMADSFPNFFNSINNLFYQIAMITTDISASPAEKGVPGPLNNHPRAANGFGAFQDGKFLEFIDQSGPTGEYILRKDSSNRDIKFRNTIQRKETLDCDQGVSPYAPYAAMICPSGDERGVYALNLAANRNEKGFFRAGAHLAVIVLSDEDERSRVTKGDGSAPVALSPKYELEDLDLPATFVANMANRYPSKSVSVHSVIIAPGDYACWNQQSERTVNNQIIRPSEGFVYAELARPSLYNSSLLSHGNLVEGVIGSICETNYSAQLGDIASRIQDSARQNVIQMPCTPDPNDINVTPKVDYTVDSDDRLIFSNLPLGVEVSVTYLCPASV